MKKLLMMGVLAIAGAVVAVAQDAAPSGALADARAKIGQVIENPESVKAVMAGLSAEDQKKFVADVNKAIASMKGSRTEKSAKFLNVNHAALAAAKKGNLAALVAEVFATVPPDALTLLNERFAKDLLNRTADPNVTYTDAKFTEICQELMAKINERTAETDNASTRSTFAILMMVRASNGTPADLADKLADTLKNEEARDLAKREWIPFALGQDGHEQSYEPLLAASDAGSRPDFAQVLVIAGPQQLEALLADLSGKMTDQTAFAAQAQTPIIDAIENPMLQTTPNLQEGVFGGGEVSVPAPGPSPYAGQN